MSSAGDSSDDCAYARTDTSPLCRLVCLITAPDRSLVIDLDALAARVLNCLQAARKIECLPVPQSNPLEIEGDGILIGAFVHCLQPH